MGPSQTHPPEPEAADSCGDPERNAELHFTCFVSQGLAQPPPCGLPGTALRLVQLRLQHGFHINGNRFLAHLKLTSTTPAYALEKRALERWDRCAAFPYSASHDSAVPEIVGTEQFDTS
jgi:hypothetical protein